MQEVNIKDNELGIPVYFADKPIFSRIPDSAIHLLMQDLETEIVACIEKRMARRKYRKTNREESDDKSAARPP